MAEYATSLAREVGNRLDTKCDRLMEAVITGDIGQFLCAGYYFTNFKLSYDCLQLNISSCDIQTYPYIQRKPKKSICQIEAITDCSSKLFHYSYRFTY